MRYYLLGILCLSLLASCAEPAVLKPRVIVKTVVVREPGPSGPPTTKLVDKCPEDIAAHSAYCNKIKTKSECDEEQRCQWYGSDVRRAHCRRLYCKPAGKPYPPA